jgi:acetyltransferase-like isoleucine patch superfamily enzyme
MMHKSRAIPHDWFPKPLPENVQIGDDSWVYSSFAFLHYRSRQACGVRIGSNTGVYNGTFFDLDVDGQVVVGNYCTLVGPIFCVNGRVTVSDYVFIAHEVTIADHFAATPPGAAPLPCPAKAQRDISIGEGAWIGARAILLAGVTIGPWAVVGAGSVISADVPPYSVVAGNPASRVR